MTRCFDFLIIDLMSTEKTKIVPGGYMDEKERLLKAAYEEMKLHSLKFTMDDIAKRLRASKSSVYKVVSSKGDLISLLMEERKRWFDEEKEALFSEESSVKSRLMHFCSMIFKTFWDFPDGFYADFEMKYPKLCADWYNYREEKLDDIMVLLREGVEKGEFRDVNLLVVRQTILWATRGLTDRKFLEESNLTAQDAMVMLEDVLRKGLEQGDRNER